MNPQVESYFEELEIEPIQCMINSARLDYGLEKEAAFVVGAAYLDGFLKPGYKYNEELLYILRYPEDDVTATLRLRKLMADWSEIRFTRFAKKYGIDLEKMRRAHEIADWLVLPNRRFSRGIRPHAYPTEMEAVTNLFLRAFNYNPCLHVGESMGGAFFDYEKNFHFEIAPESRLSFSPAVRHKRPFVYFRLVPGNCSHYYYAPFICIVPLRLTTELKYSKMFTELFPVGITVAHRILKENFFNFKSHDPTYLSLRTFDTTHGALNVLCTNNSRKKVFCHIREVIQRVAQEKVRTDHRHVLVERYKISSIVGPGLQIIDIFLSNKVSDSLSFELKADRSMSKVEMKELSQLIRRINSLASFTLFSEENTSKPKFIVTFPSVDEANDARRKITAMGCEIYHIRPYPQWQANDFFGRNPKRKIEYEKFLVGASCLICFAVSEKNDIVWLELCGHTYCTQCFMQTVQHAQKFPIPCAAVNCVGTMTFDDFDTAFSNYGFQVETDLSEFLKPVIQLSFDYFLRSMKRGYKKCMTLDCNGILDIPQLLRDCGVELKPDMDTLNDGQKRILKGMAVVCGRCEKRRCGFCGFDFHYGVDCQEYYAINFVYNDQMLASWKKAHPSARRFCPNNECHILMEKAEGCNHIQCTVCRVHFCWLCKDFQTLESKGIYEHMTKVHGGNGIMMENVLEELYV